MNCLSKSYTPQKKKREIVVRSSVKKNLVPSSFQSLLLDDEIRQIESQLDIIENEEAPLSNAGILSRLQHIKMAVVEKDTRLKKLEDKHLIHQRKVEAENSELMLKMRLKMKSRPSVALIRFRLLKMLQKYDPKKIRLLNAIMTKFEGRETELLEIMIARYEV